MKKTRRSKNPTIKHKLIVLVIGFLLLFFFVMYTLIFWFQSVLENKISDLSEQTMETLTSNMEMYINNNVRLSNSIVGDSEFTRLLRENHDLSSATSVWSMVELLKKLKNFSLVNQSIYSIALFNADIGKMLSTTDGIYDVTEMDMTWKSEMKRDAQSMRIAVELEAAVPIYSAVSSKSMVSIVRRLPGTVNENYLFVNFDKTALESFIGKIDLWKGTVMTISSPAGRTFYTAGEGLSLSNLPSPLNQQTADSMNRTVQFNQTKYIAVQQILDSTGWKVTLFIPQHEIMDDVIQMKHSAIFILIGVATLSLFFFSVLYLQIFTPIKKLMHGMVKVEKGFPFQPIRINRMDELGFLQQRFNDMVLNEQQMRRTLLEEQLHKKEIELKFLQSQVNPHFLYNTLDSIYWVAESSGVEEIGDVVLDMSRFFRLSLSHGKDFVTVREMVEHLKCYLRIQQFRHIDKFIVKWYVEDHLESLYMMKLMLQPVVENAIIHGLETVVDDCELTIRIEQREEFVVCSVHDTGVGMNDEQLMHLIREIKRTDGSSETTYGMRNLYQRLLILYGDDMDFQLWSKPQEGTRVTISIRLTRLEVTES